MTAYTHATEEKDKAAAGASAAKSSAASSLVDNVTDQLMTARRIAALAGPTANVNVSDVIAGFFSHGEVVFTPAARYNEGLCDTRTKTAYYTGQKKWVDGYRTTNTMTRGHARTPASGSLANGSHRKRVPVLVPKGSLEQAGVPLPHSWTWAYSLAPCCRLRILLRPPTPSAPLTQRTPSPCV